MLESTPAGTYTEWDFTDYSPEENPLCVSVSTHKTFEFNIRCKAVRSDLNENLKKGVWNSTSQNTLFDYNLFSLFTQSVCHHDLMICSLFCCFSRDGTVWPALNSLGMTEICDCSLPTVPVGAWVWLCFHGCARVSIKLLYRWCSH